MGSPKFPWRWDGDNPWDGAVLDGAGKIDLIGEYEGGSCPDESVSRLSDVKGECTVSPLHIHAFASGEQR